MIILMGLINTEIKNKDESQAYFEKVLELKPEQGRVKEILMKELESKIKNAEKNKGGT